MSHLRAWSAVVLAITFAALVWRLAQFLAIGVEAARWPYELDYGEGIVWQQARWLFTARAFGPIDEFPAIVYHYPPVYHAATVLAHAVTGADMLMAGRGVSIVSTLLMAGVAGLLAASIARDAAPRARLMVAACSGLSLFCMYPVLHWASLMRVDMLALFLSLLGFWCGLKAAARPSSRVWIAASVMCFVAAVFTKQTSVAAPAALFVLLWRFRPKTALAGLVGCVALGLIVLAGLTWVTGGGFVRHVFLYNMNRVQWDQLQILAVVFLHSPFVAVALITTRRRIGDIRRRHGGLWSRTIVNDPADFAFVAVLAYVAAATPLLLLIAKSGSAVNYVLEWHLLLAILVGAGVGDAAMLVSDGQVHAAPARRLGFVAIVVPAAILGQAITVQRPDFGAVLNASRATELAELSARLRDARGTQGPVISDDMVLVLRSGGDVVWEPAIFAELASRGVWDERPFVARVRRREFAMFVTVGARGSEPFDSRYTTAVADAMDQTYPVKTRLAGYVLHLPSAGPAVHGSGAGLSDRPAS